MTQYQVLKKVIMPGQSYEAVEWQYPVTDEEKEALILDESALEELVCTFMQRGIMCNLSHAGNPVMVTSMQSPHFDEEKVFITYEKVIDRSD